MIKVITIYQIVFLEVCPKKWLFLAKILILEWGLEEIILISTDSRMGNDYDIEEKIQRNLNFNSIMMFDKGYNYISNSIPGSMSQKRPFFAKISILEWSIGEVIEWDMIIILKRKYEGPFILPL